VADRRRRASPPRSGSPAGDHGDGSVPLLQRSRAAQVPRAASTETGHSSRSSRDRSGPLPAPLGFEVDGKTYWICRRRDRESGFDRSSSIAFRTARPVRPRRRPYRASGVRPPSRAHAPTTRDQWLFVNGRPVKDRALLHASRGPTILCCRGERFPWSCSSWRFLRAGDVNVHPTKRSETCRPRRGHELVRLAVRRALETERPAHPSPDSPAAPRSASRPVKRIPHELGVDLASPRPASGSEPGSATRLFERTESGGIGALVPLAQYRESYSWPPSAARADSR